MTNTKRALFSLLKKAEGGYSFKDAAFWLKDVGIDDVRREESPYVGHYGLSVPKRWEARAERILFGYWPCR